MHEHYIFIREDTFPACFYAHMPPAACVVLLRGILARVCEPTLKRVTVPMDRHPGLH